MASPPNRVAVDDTLDALTDFLGAVAVPSTTSLKQQREKCFYCRRQNEVGGDTLTDDDWEHTRIWPRDPICCCRSSSDSISATSTGATPYGGMKALLPARPRRRAVGNDDDAAYERRRSDGNEYPPRKSSSSSPTTTTTTSVATTAAAAVLALLSRVVGGRDGWLARCRRSTAGCVGLCCAAATIAVVLHVAVFADVPPTHCRSPFNYYLHPDCQPYP